MSRLETILAATLVLALVYSDGHTSSSAQSREITPVASKAMNTAAEDPLNLFTEANKQYRDENYGQAAQGYARLILSGVRNGEMYYNLGNSYFKQGKLGKAILSYRLAELYLPRDQDIKTNLAYAREMTRDRIEPRQLTSFIKEFCFWYSKLNLKELLTLFLIAHFLCWTIALTRLWWRNDLCHYLFLVTLCLAVVLGFSLGFKFHHTYYSAGAVVTAQEVSVRAGNGISTTVLFQLHDGAECTVIEQESNWAKIELADGKRGWIESRWLGRCLVQFWPVPSG